MVTTEIVRPVWTSDEGSMAQETARKRWSRIVQDMVDSLNSSSAAASANLQQQREAIQIQGQLQSLRQEIVDNAKIPPIDLQRDPDARWYNKQLGALSQLSWQAAPWLFAECYLYRRVQALFACSVFWQDYDVFKAQKDSALTKSSMAVQELAARYIANTRQSKPPVDDHDLRFTNFVSMMQVSLWGNATDLSLLERPTLEDLQSVQKRPSAAMVVDDDLGQLWSYLKSSEYSTGYRSIDIVLDNAGFELLTDLVLAMFLLDEGYARRVELHTKTFPWFVSDATASDVDSLMGELQSSELFPDRKSMDPLCNALAAHFSSKRITTTQHWFWTSGSAFSDMPHRAPDLYQHLCQRDLVIFKGDLNYRKLTGDGLWPHRTPFKSALGPLGSGSNMQVLALRTNKADVCVGLDTQDQIEQLDRDCPGGGWVRNGKYGVMSFSDGK